MKEIITRLVTHWKSSLIAIIICGASIMVYKKQITVEEWVMIMGSLGTVYALLKKDDDINNTPTVVNGN